MGIVKLGDILGTRMRKVNEVKAEVLSRAGRYRELCPEGRSSKNPAPLKVKEVSINSSRYIVCLNPTPARPAKMLRIVKSLSNLSQRRLKEIPKL